MEKSTKENIQKTRKMDMDALNRTERYTKEIGLMVFLMEKESSLKELSQRIILGKKEELSKVSRIQTQLVCLVIGVMK